MDDAALSETAESTPAVVTGVATRRGPLPFNDVYRVELPLLVRFVMKHGARPDQARDAAQEAFTQAYKTWESISHPARWLRTVAVRVYFRQKFKEHLPGELPDPSERERVPTNIQLSEQESLVYDALAQLPYRQRQVMAWFYDGYSYEEIARILGIEQNAVRQNVHRARAALKEILGIQGGA